MFFSVVLGTRGGATEFSGPVKLLKDMRDKMASAKHFEVIIRGDDDDPDLPKMRDMIRAEAFPFRVEIVTGSRGRGYEDLYKFYNDCYLLTSAKKDFIFSLPEDVVINFDHWDQFLIDEFNTAKKKFGHSLFTMHQSLQPGFVNNYDSCLEYPDSFPIYSKDFMEATGGFSHTAANDSWVQATHYFLQLEYGLDIRHFLSKYLFTRHVDFNDHIAAPRWANQRMRNHELMRRTRVKHIIKTQALTIYTHICAQKEGYLNERNTKDITAPNVYDLVNWHSDRYGAASTLFRNFYNYINSATKTSIADTCDLINRLAERAFRLRSVLPWEGANTKDIFQHVSGDIENLNKPFKSGFSSLVPYRMTDGTTIPEITKQAQDLHDRKQAFKYVSRNYGYRKTFVTILRNYKQLKRETS